MRTYSLRERPPSLLDAVTSHMWHTSLFLSSSHRSAQIPQIKTARVSVEAFCRAVAFSLSPEPTNSSYFQVDQRIPSSPSIPTQWTRSTIKSIRPEACKIYQKKKQKIDENILKSDRTFLRPLWSCFHLADDDEEILLLLADFVAALPIQPYKELRVGFFLPAPPTWNDTAIAKFHHYKGK